jgi:hypothetical protein
MTFEVKEATKSLKFHGHQVGRLEEILAEVNSS